MNDKVKLTRDEIRKALVETKHAPARELVTLFGVEIELQQPTLNSILSAREEADERERTTDVFLKYAYVPDSDELVFEDKDRETILNWPFTDELMKVQTVILKLTGVDLADAMEDLKKDPLEDSS